MIWSRLYFIPVIGALLAAGLVLVYLLFFWLGETRERSDILDESELLLHSVESGVVRSVQDVYGRMSSIRAQLQYQPDLLFEPAQFQSYLQTLIEMTPQLRELAVVANDGLVLASSVEGAMGQQTQGLSCLNDGTPNTLLHFSRLLPGRTLTQMLAPEGIYQLPACLPYGEVEQGKPKGWIVAVLNPGALREQFRPLVERLPVALTLYRYDGLPLVSEPADGYQNDQVAVISQLRSHLQAQDWGSFLVQTAGREVQLSYRATSMFPILLTIEYDISAGLAAWHTQIEQIGLVLAAVLLLIAIVSAVFWMLARRHNRMADELHLLGTAISTTANAVIITDTAGRVEWVNRAFTKLTGYETEQVLGHTPALLNSGMHPKLFFANLWQTITAGQVWRGEVVNRTRAGEHLIVDQTITPIVDDNGNISHYIAVHEDVTARREAEQRALFLAFHDQLTGLPNRRRLSEQLAGVLSGEEGRAVGLLYIDLDNFKNVNDTLGHSEGDALLVITVKRLSNTVSSDICLARLGGDEFAMLVTDEVDETLLETLAARVISVLAQPVELNGTRFQLTASVGIAIGRCGETEPATLLRQADLAMYKAKHDGRDQYRFFDQQMDYLMQRRVDLEQGLRAALGESDALSMRYQPIFDAHTLRPLGVEVLMRWQAEDGSWISPAEFIPVAEESGMIVELGAWQIDQVLAQLKQWDAQELGVNYLSLNVSAVQLARDNIASRLLQALGRYHLGTDRLVVEITETTLMSHSASVRNNLAALEAAGIRISIDDFGTGYSSLGYLKELRADYLKIDRSFVLGIGHNRSDEEIINAMLALARSLQMKVVAEGVDSEHQLRYLQEAGCDLIQGFLLSKPRSAEEIVNLFGEVRRGLTVLVNSSSAKVS